MDSARLDEFVVESDWTGVCAIVESINVLASGNPLRRPLMKVMDQMRDDHRNWEAVAVELFSYGRTLDFEGSWALAADVFGTVADIARADRNPKLAIDATTALGGAARRSGDWDRSAEGYAEAAHLASALGDQASGLTVRVGTANTHFAKGNFQAAEGILNEVIKDAVASGLDGVAALALHTRSSLASVKGDYAEAIQIGYQALAKTSNSSAKDAVLADLAESFRHLGMHDVARDAYLIVSVTSRLQWVRWQALINLMELDFLDGNEAAFDNSALELRNSALDPRLRSYYLLFYGVGCITFGRSDEGRRSLEEARDYAFKQKVNQVGFEAEKELSLAVTNGVRGTAGASQSVDTPSIPAEVNLVARALTHLRELALSSPHALG